MDAKKDTLLQEKRRQVMDFAPRKSVSRGVVSPKVTERERRIRETAEEAKKRREAVHRQIAEQNKEDIEREARVRAAREELDARKEAEARRQRQLEIERRREQERARREAELERNQEYEERRKKAAAVRRLAEREAEEREAEERERRRQYEALLKQQQAEEARRQAARRREQEEKHVRAEARRKQLEAEQARRDAAAKARLEAAEKAAAVRREERRIEAGEAEPAKPAENRPRYISGFPRRRSPAVISAPGSQLTRRSIDISTPVSSAAAHSSTAAHSAAHAAHSAAGSAGAARAAGASVRTAARAASAPVHSPAAPAASEKVRRIIADAPDDGSGSDTLKPDEEEDRGRSGVFSHLFRQRTPEKTAAPAPESEPSDGPAEGPDGLKDQAAPEKPAAGIDSRKLGSLDDFEADLLSLEQEDEVKHDASLRRDPVSVARRDAAEKPDPAAPRQEKKSFSDFGFEEDDGDELDRAISSLGEDDGFLTEKVSRNNSRYMMGGKSPFINTDKVEKRPLSSITREMAERDEMPHKNIYARRVAAAKNERDVPTMVVDSESSKGSNISLVIAIILTVVLGAFVGTIAYLALFQ